MTTEPQIEGLGDVLDGPSQWDLMLALFVGREPVSFTFAPYPGLFDEKTEWEVKVLGVSRHGDGQAHDWSINVSLRVPGKEYCTLASIYAYSLQTRKGLVDFRSLIEHL